MANEAFMPRDGGGCNIFQVGVRGEDAPRFTDRLTECQSDGHYQCVECIHYAGDRRCRFCDAIFDIDDLACPACSFTNGGGI